MPSQLVNVQHFLAVPVQAITILTLAMFLVALFWRGLVRSHWAQAAYVAVECAYGVVAVTLSLSEITTVFRVAEIIKAVLAVAVIWCLCRSLFARYPSIGSFASRAAAFTVAGCVLLGWISFMTDPELPVGRDPEFHFFISVTRAITTGLLGFLFVLSVFVGWFPVRMGRNLARELIGFLMILTASWMDHLVSNAYVPFTPLANTGSLLIVLGAGLYWLFTIVPAGEYETSATAPKWDPERLERMTAQLAQMEAQLSRRGY